MNKFLISTAFSLCAIVSIADTWGEAEGWVYTPKYPSYNAIMVQEWAVYDSRGNVSTLVYDSRSGTIDGASLNQALKDMKLSVSSVFQNMAYLAQDVVVANYNLAEMDKELQDLDSKLDNAFATIFSKMKEIDTRLESPTDSGGTTPTTVERVIVEKTQEKIVIAGGVEALKVDGKTIGVKDEGTSKACYQIKGYPPLDGYIPFSTEYSGLVWDQPREWADNKSISIDVNSIGIPTCDANRNGFHLSGWYSPSISPNRCDETIADNLTAENPDTSHYVLTRYGNGNDLHYMRIGKLENIGGGYAVKFQGTSGNPVILGAPASKTNTVTFASAADSNVAVTVGGNNDAVTITIGVYYK